MGAGRRGYRACRCIQDRDKLGKMEKGAKILLLARGAAMVVRAEGRTAGLRGGCE